MKYFLEIILELKIFIKFAKENEFVWTIKTDWTHQLYCQLFFFMLQS